MRRSRLIAVLFIVAAPGFVTSLAVAEENTLSQSEKRSGWKLLFDGKSLDQWRNYKSDTIKPGWKVEDGAIVRGTEPGGDIVTKEEFGSFELSLEYKISKGGNSGLMFHVKETSSAPWHTGPEVQIQDNVDGHDPQKAGWLYQLYPPDKDWASGQIEDATRPVGEWNHIQLRVTPAGCEINMNGHRYGRFQIGSDEWNAKVAKSKFAKYPGFGKAGKGHICLQEHGSPVAFRNIKIRELPDTGIAPDPIDGTLALKVEEAFPKLQWAGWSSEESGKLEEFRPIVVTHAGDGSNRVFVATQQGVIYVFDNKADATKAEVFLDLRDRVTYRDNENEEGLLGLAFHPKFKENGEFVIFYNPVKGAKLNSVVSRFRVSKSNKNQGDPKSEEELLRIQKPFWNHTGGTVAFGPDGYLYVGMGDGGAANDPYGNGQNLGTLLGKILRIDVDHKDAGLAYAIPQDNPFVGKEGAKPEIYAYGIRNIWRLAFDRQTGSLWCADVGQNLWEEIDIITKGGNYGWSVRESAHPFGKKGSGKRDDLIDPIWEYDHQVGMSITGGLVYRGKKLPSLAGKYVYGDYVSGKIYALKYDEKEHKVISNEAIPSQKLPMITFGDDEQGEIYFTIVTPNGKGIFKFAESK